MFGGRPEMILSCKHKQAMSQYIPSTTNVPTKNGAYNIYVYVYIYIRICIHVYIYIIYKKWYIKHDDLFRYMFKFTCPSAQHYQHQQHLTAFQFASCPVGLENHGKSPRIPLVMLSHVQRKPKNWGRSLGYSSATTNKKSKDSHTRFLSEFPSA